MRIFFPWGKGIGTLGFEWKTLYFDFSLGGLTNAERHVRMFVSHRTTDGEISDRSWYRLTIRGWRLVKREDSLGVWTNGHRHPPMLDLPADPHSFARSFAKEWKPYAVRDVYGERVEIISYPYFERDSVRVKVREPNDPTTMRDFVLVNFPEPFPGARERFVS
jgi:hypothetical protein